MPKTLLLADDSVTIQKVVGISFANEDVVLLTVSNGDAALERAREVRPDLILADVLMPGKDGYEVCEAVKQDPDLQHVPVVLLSGTFESFDEERARAVGADAHVTKPFEAQALVDQVNELLERSAPTLATGQTSEAQPADDFDFLDEDFASSSREGTWQAPAAPRAARGPEPETSGGRGAIGTLGVSRERPGDSATIALIPDGPPPLPGAGDELTVAAFDDDEAAGLDAAFGPPPLPPAEEERGAAPPTMLLDSDDLDPFAGTDEDPGSDIFDFDLDRDGEPEPIGSGRPEEPRVDAMFESPTSPRVRELPAVEASRGWDFEGSDSESDTVASAEIADVSPPGAAATLVVEPHPVAALERETTAERHEWQPELQRRIQESLEKIVWDAFGDLSERVVKEVLERVEAVAWEVVPQMADVLIREEIRRLKEEEAE
jgi:CheY-like chemotaxis protein